ncbi:hypothetical protein C8Q76DRAFT_856504 [Earliella scabrosa]|nr:hypothetical protein C8Q76DRAFT_856504 [Earliella scabrosa]
MSFIASGVAAPDPTVQKKYIEERDKRIRAEGATQFIRLSDSDRFKFLSDDPWVDHDALNGKEPTLKDGDDVKFLILGAGFGGLLFAVRLIQAGFSASDIRFVDDAGGFGGTWYWNRYPGLMCDTESYIYMPLLEETGYMPTSKYAHGSELREHAERIASMWNLTDKALWRSRYTAARWNEDTKRWIVQATETRGRGDDVEKRSLQVHAQFLFLAAGVLNAPHIPRLQGLEDFFGVFFHTSRWDYAATGGSPTDWDLPALADKRVGIIGTGATAVQVVPQLARSAKQLFVFQRTPSSVDERGQRPTDPEEWRTKIAAEKGWQLARSRNFSAWVAGDPDRPAKNLVEDAWSRIPSYAALIGGPASGGVRGPVAPERIPEHIAALHAMDLERTARVRARVDAIVQNKVTAEKLKPWYPSWCKRPTFHDNYLPAFNRPNVTLVDTDGKGVDRVTAHGVVVNGEEYPVDVLVLSTGYVSPVSGTGSPASRACVEVWGKGGRSIDDKWIEDGAGTLHGIATNGYPNFFFPGPSQSGVTANFTCTVDTLATHVASVLKEAVKQAGGWSDKLTVEVTKEAEEAWTLEIVKRAAWYAAVSGCTPSYLNNEGERDRIADPQSQFKSARGAPWAEGLNSFRSVLEKWLEDGGLKGIAVTAG